MNETAHAEIARTTERPAERVRVARGKDAPAAKDSAAASVAEAREAQPPQAKVEHIPPQTHMLAEFKFQGHFCIAAKGTSPYDLDMHQQAFALIAPNLSMFDDVRVADVDGQWVADLVVVDCGPTFAVCRLRDVIDLTECRSQVDQIPDNFEIRRVNMSDTKDGLIGKWLVQRKSDGIVLSAGHSLDTYESARRFMMDHSTVRGEVSQSVFRRT